ncbi:MAG TPA: hypothetical protein VK034_12615, partial [Enhygromyxa sp.]|nr:hypothetical protein [Enhygromyxa sp.]
MQRHASILALTFVLALSGLACERGRHDSTRVPMGPPLEFATTTLEPEFGEPTPALDILARELQINFAKLTSEAVEDPAYFMAYDLVRVESLWLEANDGALDKRHIDDDRTVDVDVRVGDPMLDNGHPTNGFYGGNGLGTGIQISLEDDPLSLAQALWMV